MKKKNLKEIISIILFKFKNVSTTSKWFKTNNLCDIDSSSKNMRYYYYYLHQLLLKLQQGF